MPRSSGSCRLPRAASSRNQSRLDASDDGATRKYHQRNIPTVVSAYAGIHRFKQVRTKLISLHDSGILLHNRQLFQFIQAPLPTKSSSIAYVPVRKLRNTGFSSLAEDYTSYIDPPYAQDSNKIGPSAIVQGS